jgi:hypothetical protein
MLYFVKWMNIKVMVQELQTIHKRAPVDKCTYFRFANSSFIQKYINKFGPESLESNEQNT